MSRHISIAAFLATVLVAVPAGWHVLDADIQTDGPATRPAQQVLHTAGADITLDLDRGVLMKGNTLKATLVATSETPKKIALTVRALEDNGIGGERTPNPPTVVSRKKVIIDAAPGGGKPLVIAFDLGGRRAKKGRVEWFDIDVAPAGIKSDSIAYFEGEDDDGNVVPANAARAGAAVWGGNSYAMTVEPPARIPAEGPFSVTVRMKNTTKQAWDYAEASLGGPQLAYNGMEGLTALYQDEPDFDVVMQDQPEPDATKPGGERVYTFDITPKKPGVKSFTLVAQGRVSNGAAMDVITFTRPTADQETQPTIAANTK